MKDYIYGVGIGLACAFGVAFVLMPGFLWLTMPDATWSNISVGVSRMSPSEWSWAVRVLAVTGVLAGLFVGAMKPWTTPRLAYDGRGRLGMYDPETKEFITNEL